MPAAVALVNAPRRPGNVGRALPPDPSGRNSGKQHRVRDLAGADGGGISPSLSSAGRHGTVGAGRGYAETSALALGARGCPVRSSAIIIPWGDCMMGWS